jgi:hypothetical protein
MAGEIIESIMNFAQRRALISSRELKAKELKTVDKQILS